MSKSIVSSVTPENEFCNACTKKCKGECKAYKAHLKKQKLSQKTTKKLDKIYIPRTRG